MGTTPYASGLFGWDTPPLPVPVREAGLSDAHTAKAKISSGTRTSQILAELLDSAAATQLQHALIKNSYSLKQAFAALPAQQQSQLRETFGVQTLGTLFSISSDPNDNSAALGLLSLADGFAAQGKVDWALSLYQELQSSHFSETVTQHAHAGQQALMGQGPIVPRLSLAIRQSKDQIVNGPMLASIVVGGASFKLFRSLLTGPLFPAGTFMAPIPYWTTRGLMNGAAVLGESAVFVAAHKVIDWGLGKEVHFSREEFLSTTGMLGSLRLAGAFMGAVGRGLVAGGVSLPYLPQVLGAVGMYGGIVGSQLIDQHLIQEGPAQGIDWFNAGVTLSHFIGAGYLLKHIHRMMPESFQKWEARMEQRVADALDRSRPWLGNLFPPSSPHAITDTGLSAPIPSPGGTDAKIEGAFRTQSLEPSSSGGDRLAEQAVDHIEQLILEPGNKFRKLLSEVDLPPEVRAIGLQRLAYLVSNAELESSRGSYLNWITLLALKTLTIGPRNFPSIHLRDMLETLYTGGPLKSYEARLADMMESEDRLLFGVPGQGTGLSDKVVTEYTKLAIRNSPSHHSAHLRRIRMRHIFQSEKGDMAAAKLRELTDEHAELVGFRQRYDLLFPSNSVNGSQLNGYFDHSRLATLVTELMIQMPVLLETNGRRSRFEECQRRLTEFLKKRSSQESLTESEIVAALETLGDPASIKMAKEIKDATNLLFSLRDHGQLMALIEEAYRKSLSDPSRSLSSRELETLKSRFANVSGMFFPPEVLLPGRAAIVIEPLDGEPTPQSLFHLLMGLRHEFAHFESIRSANTLIARTAAEEAFAYGSEARYGEWHGELTLLTRALDESPQGVGIYLRNFAESQPTNIYF